MLSNAYFLVKFRFDTDENEPPKIANLSNKNAFLSFFLIYLIPLSRSLYLQPSGRPALAAAAARLPPAGHGHPAAPPASDLAGNRPVG